MYGGEEEFKKAEVYDHADDPTYYHGDDPTYNPYKDTHDDDDEEGYNHAAAATENGGTKSILQVREGNSTRLRWIQAIRSVVSSAADVFTDWWFYYKVITDYSNDPGADLDMYELPLLVVCIVSSVMCFLLVVSQVRKIRGKDTTRCNQFFLSLEVFLEDIPQIVLTVLISRERNVAWSTSSLFNVSVSGFNLFLNVLEFLEEY